MYFAPFFLKHFTWYISQQISEHLRCIEFRRPLVSTKGTKGFVKIIKYIVRNSFFSLKKYPSTLSNVPSSISKGARLSIINTSIC